jgi:hypothetical protein
MNLKYTALLTALAAGSASAFTAPSAFYRTSALKGLADDDIESQIERAVSSFPLRCLASFVTLWPSMIYSIQLDL